MKIFFVKAFTFLSALLVFTYFSFAQTPQPTPVATPTGSGIGSGLGGNGSSTLSPATGAVSFESLRILSKVAPQYTDEARKNAVEGVVRLRVFFSDLGQVTDVIEVSGLPFGLTEQAIAAARLIKFEPARRNRIPISVVKIVEYNFSMYYDENDDLLKKNAEITEKPEAIYPEVVKSLSGVVMVELVLKADGKVSILKTKSDLPEDFKTKAVEAATKIKFTPAVHKSGKNVSQHRFIEYVFKQ